MAARTNAGGQVGHRAGERPGATGRCPVGVLLAFRVGVGEQAADGEQKNGAQAQTEPGGNQQARGFADDDGGNEQQEQDQAARPAVGALMPRQTSASRGKKTWTRISTPIQRPSGIDQPRIVSIVEGRAMTRCGQLCWMCDAHHCGNVPIASAGRRRRGWRRGPPATGCGRRCFNVLAPRIEGARFLDLYAGSGAVGIEALSRGAAQVVFVERAPAALKALRKNLDRLGITEGFEIHAGSVTRFFRGFGQKRETPRSGVSRSAV